MRGSIVFFLSIFYVKLTIPLYIIKIAAFRIGEIPCQVIEVNYFCHGFLSTPLFFGMCLCLQASPKAHPVVRQK